MIESPKKLKGLKSSQQKEKLLTISQDELSEESGPSLGVWRDGEGSQEAEGFVPAGLRIPHCGPAHSSLWPCSSQLRSPHSALPPCPHSSDRKPRPREFRAWPGGGRLH